MRFAGKGKYINETCKSRLQITKLTFSFVTFSNLMKDFRIQMSLAVNLLIGDQRRI